MSGAGLKLRISLIRYRFSTQFVLRQEVFLFVEYDDGIVKRDPGQICAQVTQLDLSYRVGVALAEIRFLAAEVRFVKHVDHLLRQIDKRLAAIDVFEPIIGVRILDHIAAAVSQRGSE